MNSLIELLESFHEYRVSSKLGNCGKMNSDCKEKFVIFAESSVSSAYPNLQGVLNRD